LFPKSVAEDKKVADNAKMFFAQESSIPPIGVVTGIGSESFFPRMQFSQLPF
jgi:hypothetical protein